MVERQLPKLHTRVRIPFARSNNFNHLVCNCVPAPGKVPSTILHSPLHIWGSKREIKATDLVTLATKLHAFCGVAEARMAQLIEQLTLNQRVTGSSPVAPTNIINGLYQKTEY